MIQAVLHADCVVTENSNAARLLHTQSQFGTLLKDNRVQLTFLETAYLLDKNKIQLVDSRGKTLGDDKLMRVARRHSKDFHIRFIVFKDLRNRGYTVKTALKFGADFRVYERGVKPGQDHAKWIVYPVRDTSRLTWQDFAAKNRVAHSTKKNLLIAVVDEENDVTYWEVSWLRP